MMISQLSPPPRSLALPRLAPPAEESGGVGQSPVGEDSVAWSAAALQEMAPPPRDEAYRQSLGQTLWQRYQEGRLELLPIQVSGRNDGADARSNIVDTALGRPAKRSSYENAPGGRVPLSFALLEGLEVLSREHDFRLTSLAGGSHSARSRHYLGVSFDLDRLDGLPVNKDHPGYRDFMAQVRALGATEVLGPGDRGHDRHLHVSWPREAAG